MNVISKDKHLSLPAVAAKVFLARGIEEATIKEIASELGVGEATIYRHYKTKAQLSILAAGYLQEEIMSSYFPQGSTLHGMDGLQAFYDLFFQVFENHPQYYRFLDEFDVFIANYPEGDKVTYEAGLDRFKDIYFSFYKEGVQDGTVYEIDDIETFYFASTHALLSLCKKLASQSVISQDSRIDKVHELKVFIEMVLYRLDKNKQKEVSQR